MKFLVLLKENFITVKFPSDAADSNFKTIEMTGNPPTLGELKSKSDWFAYLKGYGFIKGKLNVDASYLITDSLTSTTGKMGNADKLRDKGSNVKTIEYIQFIKDVIKDPELLKLIDGLDTPASVGVKDTDTKSDKPKNNFNQNSLF
jgi:hypothetical protein